jgi:hypothetical protein
MTNQRQFFQRPRLWGLLCGLTLAVTLLFTPAGAGTAQAATTTCDYTTSPPTCTTTFTYTGAAQSWTVPSGVTQATFVVDGAQGSAGRLFGGIQGTGGLGGRVRATLTVSPGQTFQLLVGGTGSTPTSGFNGGGTGGGTSAGAFYGGGGGGASDVRSGACVASLNCTLADRRLIAGGGGGGAASGGDGGSGGQLGGNGTTLGNGTAGTGGTATSGGVGGGAANGGSTPGAAGQLGLAGAGGFAACGCGGGGGGGGGLYGGGGGGWQGGGGGGSSFGPAGTTFQSGVRAGNGQITITYNIQPDTTGPVANPTLSPAPNAAGWNNTNVTVNWNWTDPPNGSVPGSGIVNSLCETSHTSNLGVGTQTFTAYCVDEASNQTQASYTVKVDRAAPAIRATLNPAANGFGWNNSAVTVSFTCQEQGTLSGIATNTVGGNQTFSSEGANFTASSTGTCTDNADNVATAVTAGPIKIDLTKPTISAAAATAPNANGWYNSDVTVQFTCADNLSGAFACPVNQTLSSEGTAVSSTAQTVSDRALNSSDASNIVTVKIDKTAPVVTLTGVTDGATYAFGSVPTTACSTTDALSGVATQATLSITGGNPDGSGSLTATCNGATDLAGNSAAAVRVAYTVASPPPQATITIALDTRPTTATDHGFGGDLGNFFLDDPNTDDGDATPTSKTFTVAPGTYTVSRNDVMSWFIPAIECVGGNTTVDLPNRRVTVTVAANDAVSCTYISERSVSLRARAYADLVRNKNNQGQRNAGDPWQTGWSFTVYSTPGVSVATATSQLVAGYPEARFLYLRPGSYTLCSNLPNASWQTTSPAAIDPAYRLPCKAVTIAAGQDALLFFGAYDTATVAAAFTAEEEAITDQEGIFDLPDTVNEEIAAPAITTTVPLSAPVVVTAPVVAESPTTGAPTPAPVDANPQPVPPVDTANFPTDDTATNPDAGSLVNRAFLPLVTR